MKWVTWSNIGIDRTACAWLIKRNIDSDAEFVFVPYGKEVTDDLGIAFDIPGKKLSHRRGNCTFLTILSEYNIVDDILKEIGKIVNGADTLNEIMIPDESKGLEAICIGMRKYLGDDHQAITQGQIIYEALYEYLKEKNQFMKG